MQQEVQVYKNICTFLFFYLFFRRFSDAFPSLFRPYVIDIQYISILLEHVGFLYTFVKK